MARYIDADEFQQKIDEIATTSDENCKIVRTAVKLGLELVSTADVRPVVRGKWIYNEKASDLDYYVYNCSICGRQINLLYDSREIKNYPFCHCGADMREVKLMTREEKVAELINIRDNFNYTLAPREVFDDAIKALEAREKIIKEIENINDTVHDGTNHFYKTAEDIKTEVIDIINEHLGEVEV